jgi:hypothetical protein
MKVMKRFASFVAVGAFLVSVPLLASDEEALQRARVTRIGNAQANSFSVEVSVVTRVLGTAFFRTAVDINNNTSRNGVTADYQFSYACVSSSCSPVGGFYRTPVQRITLQGLANFHQDDFVNYLAGLSLLQPGAVNGCIGTLLITFANLPQTTPTGWEANAVARTYNHLDESTPSSATVGFAYNASLFFDSAHVTLVGTARDTQSNPGIAGKIRSNVGVRNTDINGTGANVTVVLSFYDVGTGQLVGNRQTFSNLQPGELRQISNLWGTAGIPSTVNQVIVFVDNTAGTAATPTFEGYVTIIDGGAATGGSTSGIATQDAAYFDMRCADTPNTCGI